MGPFYFCVLSARKAREARSLALVSLTTWKKTKYRKGLRKVLKAINKTNTENRLNPSKVTGSLSDRKTGRTVLIYFCNQSMSFILIAF